MLPKPFIKLVEFRLTIPILVTYTRQHPAMVENKLWPRRCVYFKVDILCHFMFKKTSFNFWFVCFFFVLFFRGEGDNAKRCLTVECFQRPESTKGVCTDGKL